MIITAEAQYIEMTEYYCIICKQWKPMDTNPIVIKGVLVCPVHKLSELQNENI